MRLKPFLPLVVAIAAAPAAAQPDWANAASVEVRLSSFSFDPSTLRLPHGEAIDLRLVNTGNGGHNFSAPQFFAAATVNPADAAKLRRGAIEVPGHQTVEVRLVVPAAGHYELRCTHPLHSSFGMRGAIEVS
jgi:plastocyanin